jgi:cytochrome oxidase assembly protein ShyY1
VTITTNTLLLAGVLVVATCAIVIVVLAVWDVWRAWWRAGAERRVARRRNGRGMLL